MPGPATMADTSGGAGAGGRPSSSGPGKRILPHIDDITSVTVDIDMYTPIETAVIKAEAALRQAESSRSFGRPDHALAEYLKGSEIVLDIIPKNKGWVSLQRDTKSLAQRYNLLLRRLRDMHPEFEAIKEQIKADNARTGVRPKSAEKGPAKPPLGSNPNGTKMGENGVPGHKHSHSLGGKPAVHPKPANLQGKSLATNADTNDLLARFSRLRTTTQQQQQQQSASKPIPDLLSDLLPNPSPSTTALSTPIPGTQMPRMPAAIYNPPRGSISSEAAALPSSTPRSMFSRTSSTASLNGGRTVQPPSYQSIPAQNPTPTTVAAKRPKPPIPEGDTISVDDLIRLMKVGARDFSILLIDIRSREEFDDGHIMSQATICVEPEVLSRPNISANELAEAMVLAPSAEQVLFEKRHAFDLVVFYDQSSDRITDKPHDMEAKAVSGLFYALSDYDFPGPGVRKCQPKLLRGGLDAWTRVMGPSSLQSSSTSPRQKHADPPIAQAFIKNPRQRYVMKPIQDPAEAKRWEETLADAKSIEPVRSTDEFLRRFPPISNTRESMTSPVNVPRSRPQNSFHQRVLSEESLYTSLPPPPAPPPPAVPRRSYSGLAESDDSAVVAKRVGAQFGGEPTRRYRTGLTNPGVWCFANSSLQAMFAAPGFSREVRSGAWREVYKVPQKPDEKMENPQLLTRFLENLFTWLNQGSLEAITAKSFMDYTHYIHGKAIDCRPNKSPNDIFGGPCQQDAQEFYSFIMDVIHDETNTRRNRKPPKEKEYTPKTGTIIHNAMDYWRNYSEASASIVDKYFRGLEAFVSRCQNPECRQVTHLFQPCDVWILNLAGMGDVVDMYRLLENHQKEEVFPDLICETCKQRGRTRMAKFARLPDRLAFCFNRFHNNGGGSLFSSPRSGKIHARVRFPIRDLDLTRFFAVAEFDPAPAPAPQQPSQSPPPRPPLQSTDNPYAALTSSNGHGNGAPTPPPKPPKAPIPPAKEPLPITDHHFTPPFIYDCYAVTVHAGQGINGGHYIAYVQDDAPGADPADWWKCNDSVVTRVKMGSGGSGDVAEEVYGRGNSEAFMVFYRRRGT